MRVFYGKSAGRGDVSGESAIEMPLDTTLQVFRNLDPHRGFLGIQLNDRFVVQFMAKRGGGIRVELLDTSIPAFDACTADAEFVEGLIRAAGEGHDVFQIARSSQYEWEHLDMG